MKKPRETALLRRETLFQGYFRVERYVLRHSLFAGGLSDPIQREIFERGEAAAVLPYNPADDTVSLIEQFRAGAYASGQNPWLYEIVAGIVEPGEKPADVARREAVEESGLSLGRLEPIATYHPSPGGCSEIVKLFCGEMRAAPAPGTHGNPDEGEDIRVLILPRAEAAALVDRGEIANSAAMIALYWLDRHFARLQTLWKT